MFRIWPGITPIGITVAYTAGQIRETGNLAVMEMRQEKEIA